MFSKTNKHLKLVAIVASIIVAIVGVSTLALASQNKAIAEGADASSAAATAVSIDVGGAEAGAAVSLVKTTYSEGEEVVLSWNGATVDNDFIIPTSVTYGDVTYSAADLIEIDMLQSINDQYKRRMGSIGTMTTFENLSKYLSSTNYKSLSTAVNGAVTVTFQKVTPVYRLYNMITSEHLFTTNKSEYDNFVKFCETDSDAWIGEGIAWLAPSDATNATQVYRLYNEGLGGLGHSSHYYTSDLTEKDNLINYNGWVDDGTVNGFLSAGDTAIYTCYNEALGSAHHYTSSKTEWSNLSAHGWALEEDKNTKNSASGVEGVFQGTLATTWSFDGNFYQVKHILDGDESNARIQFVSGKAGDKTAAKAKLYYGYTATTPTQSTIAEDNSTVININYSKSVEDEASTYTRGAWLKTILDAYGLNVDLSNATETNFSDIEDSEYKDAIRTAEVYGFIDDEEKFSPNDVATREFAADSAVRMIGYSQDGEPDCADKSDISKSNSVYLALKTGMFELRDNEFEPAAEMTFGDGKLVTDHIAEILSLRVIDESKNKGVEFNDNAILLDESVTYEDNGTKLIVEKVSQLNNLKVGNVIVIGGKVAYKVDGFTEENGKLVITHSTPELDNFVDSIEVSEEIDGVELNNFEPAEGVELVKSTSGEDGEASLAAVDDFKLVLPSSEGYRVEATIGNISTKVNYEHKISWLSKNVYADFDFDFSVSAVPLVGSTTNDGAFNYVEFAESWKLGKYKKWSTNNDIFLGQYYIPSHVPCVGGKISFYLQNSVEGTYSVRGEWSVSGEFQIVNGIGLKKLEKTREEFSFVGDAVAKVGPKASFALTLFGTIDGIKADVSAGVAIEGNLSCHTSTPRACMTLAAYFYCDVSVDYADYYSLIEHSFFDQSNSPWKIGGHYEAFDEGSIVQVNKCSHSVESNGHHYALVEKSSLTWERAKAICETMDGYLACINNEAEQNFITQTVMNGKGGFWLGGKYDTEKNSWTWISGEPWEFENWNTGEPSAGKEYFLQIYKSGKWNNIWSTWYACGGFICEWDN